MLGDFEVSTSAQRFDFEENLRHSFSNIFIVLNAISSGCAGNRWLNFADQLLAGFVHTNQWKTRVVRSMIKLQHILHACYKGRVGIGRDLPIFAPVRAQRVFFSDLWMVIVETVGAISSSTTFSASKRTVHRRCPFGGLEQANAVTRASKAPSKITGRWLDGGLRPSAASKPSSTNFCLRCSTVREVIPKACATSATRHGEC